MIKKIVDYLKHRRPRETGIAAHKHKTTSLWQDTGQVLYLENTFKLTYTANSGLVSLEKLSIDTLPAAIQQLANLPPHSPLAKASVGNNDTAFNLSVCAVTWQQCDDRLRIKAIPEAALLRSCTSCFSRSQAVFKHEFLLEHHDTLSTLINNKAGVFTYDHISIEQFIEQIAIANKHVQKSLAGKVNIKAENFDSTFSEHETRSIDNVLNTAGSVDISAHRLG